MCKKTSIKRKTINFLLISFLFLSGCTVTKVPVFQDKAFNPLVIDKITVLPLIDLRVEKSEDMTIDKVNGWIDNGIEVNLKRARYSYELLKDRSLADNLTEEDINSDDLIWLSEVPSASSNYILVIGLNDCMSKLTFGSTGNAEVTGYLYDKANKKKLWHDKGIGKTGQGGLMGMAMKGVMARDAANLAVNNLLLSLPKKPKQ